MPDDKQDPNLARVKDLEQALVGTKHMLAQAQAERDATRAQLAALTEEIETGARIAESERQAHAAERDELQRAVDKALVDHSAVEAERARLAQEVERLKQEWPEKYDLAIDRDSLRAQLAALTAEHEDAAQAAEEHKRLADALCESDDAGRSLPQLLLDAAQYTAAAGGGPLADCLFSKSEELARVLAEVKP